jgi:hypothetical protein
LWRSSVLQIEVERGRGIEGVIVNKENRDVMNKNWGTNFDVTESLDKDKREKERKEKELAPLSIPSRRIRI